MSREIFPTGQRRIFREPESLQRKWTTLSENHVVRTKVSSAFRDCIVTVLKCPNANFTIKNRRTGLPWFAGCSYYLAISFFSKSDSKAFSAFSGRNYLTTTGISTNRQAGRRLYLGKFLLGMCRWHIIDSHPILVACEQQTYFRSSLLFLLSVGETRNVSRKNRMLSQATS